MIVKVGAVIGILDTIYLMWHKFRGTDVACIGFPKRWCQKVQYAPQSKTFGVPNSILGFLMFSGLLFVAVLQPAMPYWTVQFLVGFGALFSLYFAFVQVFVLRALCTWCVVSALTFWTMAWAVFFR
jgi:uncharacterized membrane protein